MTTKTFALPALVDAGLSRYLAEINKFPLLSEAEEYVLAKAWVDNKDLQAAHRLVTSHLRLVVKIAMKFRGYGLPLVDLISEGNVGLMQAVKKFNPEKGFRLSTYAMWWIKASIQEYVLHSWSLVKLGTTAAQKKLFFNLRRIKNRIFKADEKSLAPSDVRMIARELNVSERDVVEMEQRMSGGDHSLNRTFDDEGRHEWIEVLADDRANQESLIADAQHTEHQRGLMQEAMKTLNARELSILQARRLKQAPATLEELSQKHKISRERVRQIENRALQKLQQAVQDLADSTA